ncbi:class III lanthipeptide [Streptomyces decoyicus]|uniref:class III lanthipeptide n=1 Tax=Streptomyces decoyicus TaxID=249567 RepID=UPI000A6AF36F|nr:class III lanthipeptide [Streptomyces decoyicus]QZY16951.1 class III lanthipeptide [Streptomyces decoyicus]
MTLRRSAPPSAAAADTEFGVLYALYAPGSDNGREGFEMSIMDLQGLEVPGERDAQALGSTVSTGC